MKIASTLIKPRLLATIAGLSIALLSLIVNIRECYKIKIFSDNPRIFNKRPVVFAYIPVDDITKYGKRFDDLKKNLPATGTVGYACDVSPETGPNFLATQYFLAPLIVQNSRDKDLVVGNFVDIDVARKFASENKLVLQQYFGNGVVLFTREGK